MTYVLISCNESSDISLRVLFPEGQIPESSVLPIGPDDIREPVLLASRDSILVCTNQMTKQVLRVYNIDSGAYRDLICIGRAENELLNASAIWFSGDTLNVYSSNSGKILDHREKYFNFVVSDGLMPVRRDALRTANINFS